MLEFCKHLHKHSHISWQITTRFKQLHGFTTWISPTAGQCSQHDTKNNGLRRSKRTLYKTKLLAPSSIWANCSH